jgi:hypothetical protein
MSSLNLHVVFPRPTDVIRPEDDASFLALPVHDLHSHSFASLRIARSSYDSGNAGETLHQIVRRIIPANFDEENPEIVVLRCLLICLVLGLCLVFVSGANPIFHLVAEHCFADILFRRGARHGVGVPLGLGSTRQQKEKNERVTNLRTFSLSVKQFIVAFAGARTAKGAALH